MSVLNKGNQSIYVEYGSEATTGYINQLLTDIIPSGLYRGGTLSVISGSIAEIDQFVALVKTPENQTVKFETLNEVLASV